MRHANERRIHLDQALNKIAASWFTSRNSWWPSRISMSNGAPTWVTERLAEGDSKPITRSQRSPDLVQTALRQQEKIERYESDAFSTSCKFVS
ncbi:hypothetical protein ACNKHS_05415 [Shigella flexneri]